ncbi:toll/interleukin-1 receptor domain-containing protein [Rhodobacter sp. NTK016B]|uniref:toll/interleukin-1 receptor domain-containing protein n=1 Tax=Rhodobacter sp. NTK016B TaxID=2759676 RepID=UPI001A8E32BE|nr:toll/interleukin-1 receptor domain-containing protein [Rhodobacter sp. NTK016B]MBN8291425.1 toll/interleukin-1 receptor domain-containing protein [Rhodobacter sp. NTK016B]
MANFFTRSQFRGFTENLSLQERTNIRKRAEERSPSGTTFLSHSSKDQDILPGVIRVLENHGATVYIDKKDSSLPPYTSKDTAAKLKNRIQQSKKFVLLATENSKDSRWVPWELGVADGNKSFDNIAIFPVLEDTMNDSWTNWEYLGLYDHVAWRKFRGKEKEEWMVWDRRKNTASALAQWLAR